MNHDYFPWHRGWGFLDVIEWVMDNYKHPGGRGGGIYQISHCCFECNILDLIWILKYTEEKKLE